MSNTTVEQVLDPVARAHTSLCGAKRAAAIVVDPTGARLASWGHDATTDTVFRIASMTKSFTAATVLSLRDDAVVSLDDPIGAAAPELASVIGPGSDPTRVTLRHLLTMSSGLATDDPWADRHLDATDDDLDRWVDEGLRFAFPPGTAFEYSNLGYALVGRVIHRITGRRLQEHVRERFLDPLGMTRTAWSIDALPSGADVTQGMHVVDGVSSPTPPMADGVIAPMGGLWSSAADLGRWMAFLSSAFTPTPLDGHLRASSRREMQQLHRETPVRRSAANDGSMRTAEGGYTMGLTTYADDRLGRVVTHSGGLPGYGSNMRWVPGGVGVAICANITYAPMWHAGAAILDALGVAGLVSAPKGAAGSDLGIAAQRLADLLVAWDDATAAALFADNVHLDAPFALRQRDAFTRIATAAGAHPEAAESATTTATVVSIEPVGQAAASFTFVHGSAMHRIRFELAPTGPLAIQKYDWL